MILYYITAGVQSQGTIESCYFAYAVLHGHVKVRLSNPHSTHYNFCSLGDGIGYCHYFMYSLKTTCFHFAGPSSTQL